MIGASGSVVRTLSAPRSASRRSACGYETEDRPTFNLENLDEAANRNEPSVERRAELIRLQLIRLEADVLCLQEIHSQ